MATRSALGIGRARPPDKRDADPRLDQDITSAPNLLCQQDRRALHLERPRDDVQHVVHPCGLQELELHRTHDEGKTRRLALGFGEQRPLVRTKQAQVVGAAPLHEAEVVRVIDDAGEVRVLVIDTHLHEVASVADDAVKRRGCGFCSHAAREAPYARDFKRRCPASPARFPAAC
jgi:hypothetical protein